MAYFLHLGYIELKNICLYQKAGFQVDARGDILIIDDEINLCRIINAKLVKSGFSVFTVNDSRSALEIITKRDFDLVLLDAVMPDIDGILLLGKIHKIKESLPVIIMTACESQYEFEEATKAGAALCIKKPFDLDNLENLIESALVSPAAALPESRPASSLIFQEGQQISIEVIGVRDSKDYKSNIISIDDRTICISLPLDANNELVKLSKQTLITVELTGSDAHYSFKTYVVEGVNLPENSVLLEKPAVIYRTQRRKYQRIPMDIPLNYYIYSDDTDEEPNLAKGNILDISLGGIKAIVSEDIPIGEVINMNITHSKDASSIDTVGYVVRSVPDKENKYIIGCQFSRVDESLNDIVKQA